MVDDDTVARVGMGAVSAVGVVLALVGAALFVDGVGETTTIRLAGYALCVLGGVLSALLGAYHARNRGQATGAITGVPASMGGVALVLAATDAARPLVLAGSVAVALALIGSGLATYADAMG